MKSTRINLLAILMIVALALSSFVPVAMAAKNKPVISKKELKVLLRTANEPPQHRKIAEYYRQEAQRLSADAKEHTELAEIYAENPPFPAMEAKHGSSFGQGASHCRLWAQLDADQAKEAEALAVLHEDMAKQAEQKQP
jgi:hypothetical protein